MSTPFHSRTTGSSADGVVETQNGAHLLRFERTLPHSIERVWAAITEPEQLVTWLAEAEIDLRAGGRVQLRWLNTDERGNDADVVMNATITQLDPRTCSSTRAICTGCCASNCRSRLAAAP